MICAFAILDINIMHDDKAVPPFSNKKTVVNLLTKILGNHITG